MEGDNPQTPIWNSPGHGKHVNTRPNHLRIVPCLAIILRSRKWHMPAKLPPNLLLQNSIDQLLYRMRPNIDTPLEPSDSVVYDGRTQMAFRFDGISCLCTWGGSTRTLALGDWIRSMVNMRHRRERPIACCGYFWWDGQLEARRGKAFARRLESNSGKTVSCA